MSLRDTIDGARSEAKENVDNLTKKSAAKEAEAKKDGDVPAYDPLNPSKSSAANAKPAREAAASVRMEGERKKSTIPLTKEEKKAARAEERALEDMRNRAYDIILRRNGAYKKTDRTWWILLGIGFAMTLASLALAYIYPDASKQYTTAQGIGAIVTLVLAYAFIIGAFIYDLVKRRPFRKAAERKLQGMNDKQVADFVSSAVLLEAEEANKKKDDKKSK